MKVNLCLIGLGNFGKLIYQKAGQLKECKIKYCYHPDRKKAKSFDINKGTSNLKKTLKNVDGVIICTPNDIHFKNINDCLKANKHIFVEKPMTAFYKEALKIKPMIKKNLVFMVGHNQRKQNCFRYAKKLINEGTVGKIVSAYFNTSHGGAFSFSPCQWRFSFKRHREGPLITAGIHLMDTTYYLFGPVVSVYAKIKNLANKTEAPDCNAVILNLKNGASVFIQANYNLPSEEQYIIYGTEGSIYIHRGSVKIRLGRDRRINGTFVPSRFSLIKLRKNDSIKEELREFCQAIRKKGRIETGFKEGLNALALIEACYQSDKTNKAVFMNDFEGYDVKNYK